jgi:hypothetical protein
VNSTPFAAYSAMQTRFIVDKRYASRSSYRIFVRIGCGRLGAAEVDRVLVARHDGVDQRILPRPQTREAKLVLYGSPSGTITRDRLSVLLAFEINSSCILYPRHESKGAAPSGLFEC